MLNKITNQLFADTKGNFAIVAALLALPVVGGLMIGYDYARFSNLQQAVPAAIDAALIAAVLDSANSKLSDVEQDSRAKNFLLANLSGVDERATIVKVIHEKHGKGGVITKIKAKIVYIPMTGPLASLWSSPTSKDGPWTIEY